MSLWLILFAIFFHFGLKVFQDEIFITEIVSISAKNYEACLVNAKYEAFFRLHKSLKVNEFSQ